MLAFAGAGIAGSTICSGASMARRHGRYQPAARRSLCRLKVAPAAETAVNLLQLPTQRQLAASPVATAAHHYHIIVHIIIVGGGNGGQAGGWQWLVGVRNVNFGYFRNSHARL